MGRGLYATRKVGMGEIVATAEILLLSPDDTVAVNKTELQYYTFKVNDLQDCLVLGDGEIFNHTDAANVAYGLQEIDGRLKMVFTAVSTVEPGDQLFINYAADSDVNVKKYVDNKSLVG